MDEEEEKPVTNLHPDVERAATGATEPAVQMWAAQAAADIQDHRQQQALIDNAAATRNSFIQNTAQTRDNLTSLVRNDPTAAPLAFKLAGSYADALGAVHDEDSGEGLKSHFNSEIAAATVHGWAARDAGMAHAAIDRYSDHLSDDQQSGLRQYVDGVDMLRQADAQAAKVTQAHQMVQQSNAGTAAYMAALAHPDTGAVEFPPGWGQKMMQDPRIAPDAKAALFTGYSNLQRNGEPDASDPTVVSDLLARAALPYSHGDHPLTHEIASQLGTNLTNADAGFLASRIGAQGPAARDETIRLNETLANAREQIGNQNAFGRFQNWFLSSYQRATSLGAAPNELLDPEKGLPSRVPSFKPTGDDLIAPALKASFMSRMGYLFDREPSGPADELRGHSPADPNMDKGMGAGARQLEDTGDPVIHQREPGTFDDPRVHPGLLQQPKGQYIEARATREDSLFDQLAGPRKPGQAPLTPKPMFPSRPSLGAIFSGVA